MTDFPFKPGDKVRRADWRSHEFLTVDAVGEVSDRWLDTDGWAWAKGYHWLPYEPLPGKPDLSDRILHPDTKEGQ